jgi:hypothetical protein
LLFDRGWLFLNQFLFVDWRLSLNDGLLNSGWLSFRSRFFRRRWIFRCRRLFSSKRLFFKGRERFGNGGCRFCRGLRDVGF